MKKTRNLFILHGLKEDVEQAFNEIQFKGLVVLKEKPITLTKINAVFAENKSVVCSNLSEELKSSLVGTSIYDIAVSNDNGSLQINPSEGNIASQFQSIAEQLCFCDIGDHKSNSSGMLGVPSVEDCFYCRYMAGKVPNDKRTLYRSKHFIVIPTIGQFTSGYLLIIPTKHVMSNAELSPNVLAEFESVLEDVLSLLQLTYHTNSFLIWENGSGSGGIGKAKDSIVHSHVHVAPSSLTVEDIKRISGFEFESLNLNSLFQHQTNSYLLLKSSHDKNWMINDNPYLYIPRQYVRQVLAEEHGIPNDSRELWNWRTSPFSEKMMYTCVEVSSAIRANWNILPDRIKERTKDYLSYS